MNLPTTPDDYAPYLQELGRANLPYFIEGGQAVNALAEFFLEDEPALRRFQPYTSKDCDIWVGKETLDRIEDVLSGELHRAADPAEVQLGVFCFHGQPHKLDLFGHVHGLTLSELAKVGRRVLSFDGVRVMDPLYLFKAKCHNLVELGQRGRQDRRHVEMLQLIVPAYFRHLIQQCQGKELPQRAVIKDIKLFRGFARDVVVRRALTELGTGLDNMVPVIALERSRLSTLAAFAQGEWGARPKPEPGASEG